MRGLLNLATRLNGRSVLANPWRALLTVGGVAAGVALLFSIAVINSTLRYSIDATARGLAGDATLEVAAVEPSGLPQDAVSRVATAPGVERAVPIVQSLSRVAGPRGTRRALVVGVPGDIGTLFGSELNAVRGELRGLGPREAWLSPGLFDGVARSGGRVRFETPRGDVSVSVAGRLARAPFAALNGGVFALVSLPTAQTLFKRGAHVDSIYVRTRPGASVARVRAELEHRLAGAALVGAPGGQAKAYQRTFDSIAQLSSLAATVALFVALFVVLNTMSMSLLERRRPLAMAMAFGATRRQIFVAFLAEAAAFGAVAAAVGLGAGLVLARLLVERTAASYTLLPITAAGSLHVTLADVLEGALGGPMIAVIGAFLPARRILGLAPIESLVPEAAYEWGRRDRPRARTAIGVAVGFCLVVLGVVGIVVYSRHNEQAWLANGSLLVTLGGFMLVLPWAVPQGARLLRPLLVRLFGTVGRLAADSLLKNPGRTTVTVGALGVTAAMVVGVGTAIGSFESEVVRAANGWYRQPVFVSAKSLIGITSDQPLPASLARTFERVPGVRAAYPWRYALLNLGSQEGIIYGIPTVAAARAGSGPMSVPPGTSQQTMVRAFSRNEVLVSRYTARQRGLRVGDTLSLPTPYGKRAFRIGAIFDDLVSFESFYLDYATYARLWGDDKADRFAIVPDKHTDLHLLQQRLQRVVDAQGLPAEVVTKQHMVDAVLDTVRGLFSLARGIELAALVIAALIIANTMLTAVFERRWEFGLQRAVGMGARQLRRTVLLEAAGIGLLGGVAAIAIGLGIGFIMTRAMEIRFAWQVAFRPSPSLIVGSLAAGVALAALASIYPSHLATRIPIVRCLRFE